MLNDQTKISITDPALDQFRVWKAHPAFLARFRRACAYAYEANKHVRLNAFTMRRYGDVLFVDLIAN